MTREQVAEMLNGREYMDEITPAIQFELNNSDLVVVFGASDDLMQFRGNINDGVGCLDGGIAYLNESGLIENLCEEDDCPYFAAQKVSAKKIEAVWCDDDEDIEWTYKTDIPHSVFLIMDDEGVYCRGIVFRLADVQ